MSTPLPFLSGPITLPLVRFAIPLALALMLQALYGAVDLLIVGRLGETADVSAVGTGSLVLQTVVVVIVGVAMGITVQIAHALGAQCRQIVPKIVSGSIKLFFYASLLLTFILAIFASGIAKIMAAPPEAFAQTVAYIQIGALGMLFIAGYNVVAAIFRGVGDSRTPLLIVLFSCLFNVVGDLYFVGVLKMGAQGAAWATILAQGLSLLLSCLALRYRRLPFPLKIDWRESSLQSIQKILKIGLPIAGQDLLNYLSFMVLAAIINSMGLIASAAMGTEGKVFPFFSLIPLAFLSALSTFTAQNIGANQAQRAVQALHRAIGLTFVMGLVSFFLAFFYGEWLASLFNNNPATIAATARLLKGAAFEHLFYPLVFCLLGFFNGHSKTFFILLQGLVCALLVRIPFAYWLSKNENADLFWIGFVLSSSAFLSFLLCLGYYLYIQHSSKQKATSHFS